MEVSGFRGMVAYACALVFAIPTYSHAACTGCTVFDNGVAWGVVSSAAVNDASGIAASRRNPGVLWIINDGNEEIVFAVNTNGAHLATFNHSKGMDDVEDIAVGPGPSNGVTYVYVGDIGGDVGTNSTRDSVKIVRAPEPFVDRAWAGVPRVLDFDDADGFTLRYPDGGYEAEALMVDPLNGDIYVATKQDNQSRLYRANVNGATNREIVTMQYVRTVGYHEASAADISPEGTQILFRRENSARVWQRCDGEPIANSFDRPDYSVPVIGRPTEPNGEGVAFLGDNSGYVTISDSTTNPVIYFFRAVCHRAPFFVQTPANQVAFVGGSVRFVGWAGGFPVPTYTWRFNGQVLAGQTGAELNLSLLKVGNSGRYEVTADNPYGSVSASATLTVRARANVGITEAMPAQAPSPGVPSGDWWELTSFDSHPIDLTGWRFNDDSGGLAGAFTISNRLIIAPGESIIFAEELNAEQFSIWWGPEKLPPGMQVFTYAGSGLSLGAGGDGIRLWDHLATEANDTMARVDFGAATNGYSFIYNPVTGKFGDVAQLGSFGVVQAQFSPDFSSPGRIDAPTARPELTCELEGDSVRIEFDAIANRLYRLEVRNSVSGSWMRTGDTFNATSNTRAFFLIRCEPGGSRFFRVTVD
jgi:hypothetical protein